MTANHVAPPDFWAQPHLVPSAWLAKKGIDKTRLHAEGFGADKPAADNKTVEGRAANRRVEFHIENEPTDAKK